jgi:glycosyltransferase involved in cell wall biosynthesis
MRRLAWVSSGVDTPDTVSSFYTRTLLPVLMRSFDIEVFSEFGADENSNPAAELALHHVSNPFGAVVYNVEDRPECDFVRRVMGLIPGVAVYHDVLMSPRPMKNDKVANTQDQRTYRACSSQEAAKDPYFVHFELAQTLLGVITNERNLNEFQTRLQMLEDGPDVLDVVLLPTAIPPCMMGRGDEFESGRELPRVVFSGRPGLEDRAHHVLRAVSLVREGFSFIWMVSDSDFNDAVLLCAEFGVSADCLLRGRSPEDWSCAVTGASLALHPYFSVFGDPGVYLPISLARGVPSVVSDFSVGSLYPDSVVIKVRPGSSETEAFCELIKRAADGEVFPESQFCGIYAQENHDARSIGAQLEEVLDRFWLELERITSAWM